MKELLDLGMMDSDTGLSAPSKEESEASTLDKDCAIIAAAERAELVKSVSGISGLTTSTTERALSLLGSGVNAEQASSALGVTPARISQLLAIEHFAGAVAKLRYTNLQKHNVRDNAYDTLEDKLLAKMETALPLMVKPESILKALSIVNGAKRRGQSAPQQVNTQQQVVQLIMPTIIAQKFSVDINNQVVRAGDQSLLTMPSGNLLDRVEALQEASSHEEIPNVSD